MLPVDIDEWVSADDPVRFVADFVAHLDAKEVELVSPSLPGAGRVKEVVRRECQSRLVRSTLARAVAGLRITSPAGDQSRVWRLHRRGVRAWAAT